MKARKTIDAAVEEALTAGEQEAQAAEPVTAPLANASDETPAGMMRVEICSMRHTDGRAKKTWLRGSVIEIEEGTAQRMINNLRCAIPTRAPLREILVADESK